MSKDIVYDEAARKTVEAKLDDAKNALSNGVTNLSNATPYIDSVYNSDMSGIYAAHGKMENAYISVEAFKPSFSDYMDEILYYDKKAAKKIEKMPQTTIWKSNSGWAADPNGLKQKLIDKLVAEGYDPESDEVKAFFDDLKERLSGVNSSIAYWGDPINMSTGNFIYEKEDLNVPGTFSLRFVRFYNSVSKLNTSLGRNWTHNFNIYLKDSGTFVKIVFDDGRIEKYTTNATGSYNSPTNRFDRLEKDGDQYRLTLQNKQVYHFNPDGQIISITDTNQNATSFQYKNELLIKVESLSGNLSFSYNDDQLLTSVSDQTGRSIRYQYKNGNLITAIHPDEAEYGYQYDSYNNLCGIVTPIGVPAIRNTYDKHNRVTEQAFPDGGIISMFYEDETLTTTTTEQNGNAIRFVRDSKSRTVRIEYDDSEERFEYNNHDQKTKCVDRNGNVYKYEFDDSGNKTKIIDPIENITKISYNEWNKPIDIRQANGAQTKIQYDEKGNLIQISDPLSRQIQYTYNPLGLINTYTLPDGSIGQIEFDDHGNITMMTNEQDITTYYRYDALNRVVESTDAAGHKTTYCYNGKGEIAQVTNAEGYTRTYKYNKNGLVSRIVDFNGGTIEYRYNDLNKVNEIVDQMGNITKVHYDLMWDISGVTDPLGNEMRFEYDNHKHLIALVDAEGNTTRYEYDAKGNITAEIAPNGARTQTEYDALDRKVKVIAPDGAVTKYLYDEVGNVTAVIDPLGNTTTYDYDKAGQLLQTTDVLGNVTDITYTPLGQIESFTDATGGAHIYEYYKGGKVKRVSMPEGESVSYAYDSNGNAIKITDALENATHVAYDSLNRIISIKNPLGYEKKFEYDAVGNIIKVTDENGNATTYCYNLLGDVIEVVDAHGNRLCYEYDKMRKRTRFEQYRMIDETLSELKQMEAITTLYEHDKNGRLIAEYTPQGDVVRYAYDANGNIVKKLDEDGFETRYEYDIVDQLTKTIYADSKTVAYTYTPLKKLAEMRDWLGVTTIENDAAGHPKQITNPDGQTIRYEWDALGRKTSMQYPDNSVVQYTYDLSGKLKQVVSNDATYSMKYDATGQIIQKSLPNALETQYHRGIASRLEALINMQDGKILDDFRYNYDPSGNITQIAKTTDGVEDVFDYAYDALNRITKVQHNDELKTYTYDEIGNRIRSVQNGVTTDYRYNEMNQLVSMQDANILKEYRYDKRGNMTEILQDGAVEARYTFDATNKMTQAFNAQRGCAEYTYNGFNKRVKKLETLSTVEGALSSARENLDPCKEISYIFDLTLPFDNMIMAHEHNAMQKFVWGGMLLAQEGEQRKSYLLDHLGSPIRTADKDGVVSGAVNYDEFGVPDIQPSETGVSFGYTGFEADQITGMYFAQARYYDPHTARMVSPDPHWDINNMVYGDTLIVMPWAAFLPDNLAIAQSTNKYGYCINNPLIFVDRNGEFVITALIIGVVVASTVIGGVVGGISNASKGGSFWAGAIGGAVGGLVGSVAGIACTALGGPVLGGAAGGALSGAVSSLITDSLNNKWSPNLPQKNSGEIWADAGISFIIGGTLGAMLSGGVGIIFGSVVFEGLSEVLQEAILQAFGLLESLISDKMMGSPCAV